MPKEYKPLPRKFYLNSTVEVSKALLGKVLVRKIGNKTLAAKIVETEAYIGDHDPACHAYQKITERNKVLYDIGGKIYIYFIYGNYYCFNLVSEEEGVGSAVLIRGVEPLEGIELMKKFRGPVKSIHELTNGPAKLCLAMNIDKTLYGMDATSNDVVFVSEPLKKDEFEIITTKRIGLNIGEDYPYRFFIKDNAYVTKHKFNKEIIL